MKNVFVIDTNVLIVASLESHDLALTCLEFLEKILEEEHTILIDDFYDQKSRNYISEIANEYSSNLSSQDAAFWILQKIRSYEPDGIIKRVVVKKDKNNKYYLNFPKDSKLKKFDKSDRKFVTVAILSNMDPEIVNAVDTDWKTFETILKKYVKLKFL
jgi:predicted nucleic acid-binding protein